MSTYEIVNPATEQIVGAAPEVTVDEVESVAAAAAAAWPAWSRTAPEERANLLNRAADVIRDHIDELIPLVQAETGATLRVTKTMQVPTCVERFRRYAKGAVESNVVPLPPSEMPSTALAPGGLIGAIVVRQPVGVVACITPYNFPIVNMAGKIGPALAMGNTVVVKPAPQDPLAVLRVVDLIQQAGFPPGVVNVVSGSGAAVGEALVASKHIDMVSFTGSTVVGQRIGEVAGRDMKRLLLELGGKGAAVVFDDADIKTAVGTITSAWAFHSGQICTAPTRVLAQRGIYDQLVGGLHAAAGHLKVGDPLEADTVLGPVISSPHRERVESYVRAGADEGGTIVAGGARPDIATGYYVAPTLIADCKAGMKVVQEEIFGPVVVVVPFDDEDEGVALANGTDFGLYDYVFSSDSARAMRVAKQLRSGNVGINTAQRNHEAPFGGFKLSGVGRDGGSFGLHAYSELQTIVWPG
ncbi:MAG TPA: aldehyde dehydrogenase family protein [Acidimicrobiales bacterium]|jgi:acyl-CoA reductase-like NAD-dependent aldehyde dehydrogenase|nr:aldehyde dehydrogenase family protein [Acidimicrobiales bacterium]